MQSRSGHSQMNGMLPWIAKPSADAWIFSFASRNGDLCLADLVPLIAIAATACRSLGCWCGRGSDLAHAAGAGVGLSVRGTQGGRLGSCKATSPILAVRNRDLGRRQMHGAVDDGDGDVDDLLVVASGVPSQQLERGALRRAGGAPSGPLWRAR